jgi:hypothetical protein
MSSIDALENSIRKLQYQAAPDVRERILNQALRALDELPKAGQVVGKKQVWKAISKGGISRYAAAAAIVLLVVGLFAYWPHFDLTARAYGMMDIPRLLREARAISIHGWVYAPKAEKAEFEYQCDMQTGRFYAKKPVFDSQIGVRSNMRICDNQYLMEIHWVKPPAGDASAEPFQEILYQKVSPFYGRVETQKVFRTIVMLFGNLDRVEGAKITGQERLDGILYDVWEGQIRAGSTPAGSITLKSWLSGADGRIGRFEMWLNQPDQPSIKTVEIDAVELNPPLSDEEFSTEPLEGYPLGNTKETAPMSELMSIAMDDSDATFHIHISFTLENGAVLVGWSSQDKDNSDQSGLFENLEIGGPPPALPKEITSLKAVSPQNLFGFAGCHLAYTQKGGKYFEWALYAPSGAAPDRSSFLNYQIQITSNVESDRKTVDSRSIPGDDILIESLADFEKWVLPAMAELSDDNTPPDYVTYDFVMNLAKELTAK